MQTTVQQQRNELRELFDAMKDHPERMQLDRARRFSTIQNHIAERYVGECRHTGYPVAARP